ncbi:mechanosensitive ion channel domain-containing protein [Roseateles sp.]|uniref:mechanosensitive ion channel domain-containing protein n=1 Tax=Roseateles sp. TaxID=1971397 RepID=UPI00286BD0F2|nr:mechanosensitive ion channel domain-containing protein [Roseateles sp.]
MPLLKPSSLFGRSLLIVSLSLAARPGLALELPKGVLPEALRAQMQAASVSAGTGAVKASNPAQDWPVRLRAAQAYQQRLLLLAAGSAPLLDERKVASERRVMLLSVQLQAANDQGEAEKRDSLPLNSVPTLAGKPPFRLLDVDQLRDQLDGLLVRQAALKMLAKSLDTEVEAAAEARADAEATLRRRQDQAGQKLLSGAQQSAARPQLDLSQVLSEVADLELLQADQARSRARAGLTSLSLPIEQLQSEIARVGPQQQLSDADLASLLKEFEQEREGIATERIRLEAQLGRRESVREAGPVQAAANHAFELETLRLTVTGLRELESLTRGKADLWRARQAAAAALFGGTAGSQDSSKISAASDTLERLFEQVQSRLQISSKYGDFLRAELRTQEARVQDLLPNEPQRLEQQRLLSALQTQLNVQERLSGSLSRAVLLLTRSRSDLGLKQGPDNATDLLTDAGELGSRWAAAAWNYELFSATENTSIDGRIVTLDYGVTVGKSVGILIMLAAGYWLARWLSRLLIKQLAQRLSLSVAFARVLHRWLKTILLLVVLMIVLKLARIPITAFAFLGGALAIGVGFGAQNVIKNLISGIIILFERKIRVGDIVSVGGVSGTVLTVDLRATTVRGFDGIDAIVPNSNLLENQVSNWSGGSPDMRRVITVGVAYGADVRRAANLVRDCACAHAGVLPEPPPEVLFEDFASDALTLRLLFWFRLGGPSSGPTVDSDLRFAINDALAAAGIAIAFPQRDVHLDMAGPLRVELLSKPV